MTIVIIQFISVTLFDIIFEIMIQAVAVQIAINIKRMLLISQFYIIVFGPFLLPVYYFNHVFQVFLPSRLVYLNGMEADMLMQWLWI